MTEAVDFQIRRPVLIARPGARAQLLEEALANHGYATVMLGVMTLDPVTPDPEDVLRWCRQPPDWVICISPTAVTRWAEEVGDRGHRLCRAGVHWAATGSSTQELIAEHFGRTSLAPEPDNEEEGTSASEALLALPEFQDMTGQQILIVSGHGGRPLLEETLRARGGEVNILPLYERNLHNPTFEGQRYLEAGNYAAMIVTSREQLDHLKDWCGAIAFRRPLIVSSRRLAEHAAEQGYQRIVIARDATPGALASAMVRRAAHCDTADADDADDRQIDDDFGNDEVQQDDAPDSDKASDS
ncbi:MULTISPECIES: uroporphyrinogen-III synthase [Zymobacter]|uniref:Uroporphyrinogen-III synthase n=1 Tax=Zymobacter palmae TaxID=33074 RepID=A0A348HHR4_9GAMM|nr:uroporphyrinogen-III synthase [Zymobacter palmae]BBG31166.1 uroporphyrinogen-III synthase [Zymobacter palmae]